MTLVRDTNNPSLWTNEAWTPGSPGTLAVVIGVSRYQHLDGSAESFGLGSLFCSALTAHYVFQWLHDHYRGPDLRPGEPRPLAQVWYLVAPTDAEVDIEPALGDAPTEPTLANCSAAIGEWNAALRTLSAENAGQSTSFFFFSGHGFEVHSQEQLMLPSDYLAPPTKNVSKGMSTLHLYEALGDLTLNEQLFFVDACRNDVDSLREKNPRGETILNEPNPDAANPARIAALFHATSSGQQAFQPTDPGEGPSLFGKALLEGLRGRPTIELDGDGDTCTVNLLALNAFLKRRVPELLADRSANVVQPVWLRMNNVDDFPISVVSRHRATAVVRGGQGIRGGELAAAGTRAMAEITGERLTHRFDRDGAAMALWRQAELYDFANGAWQSATDAAEIDEISEDQLGQIVRLEFSPNTNGKQWLRINSDGASFAFALPGDQQQSPIYRLELVLDGSPDSGRGARIDQAVLDLAPKGLDGIQYAAGLWEIFRDQDLSRAASALDMDLLEELLQEKMKSPLGASVAGMVLLRTGTLWRMHTWARNLSNFFPTWPEGPVLWAHQLVQQQGEVRRYRGRRGDYEVDGHEDPLGWLLELEQRGLPALSELVSVAAEVAYGQQGRLDSLASDTHRRLLTLRERLGLALRYFRPSGLFAAFHARDPALLRPELIGW